MTEPESQVSYGNFAGRVVLLLFLATGLCLSLLVLLDRTAEFDLVSLFQNPLIWPAIVLQLTGLLLFVLAWFLLLRHDRSVSVSFPEAAAHIGITLIGKYLPGKVWGLLGRAYLLGRKGMRSADAARYLLADQFLTFYSGIAVGIVALASVYNTMAGIVLLVITAISTPVILNSYQPIMEWIIGTGEKLFSRLSDYAKSDVLDIDRSAFSSALIVYLCHWLVIGLVVCLLFYPLIESRIVLNCLLILGAIPLAMLTGFLALWAPGGIGVREGVIVAVLAINLDLQLATSIAIVYRLICVVNDLLMGSLAMLYYSKQFSPVSGE